MIDTHELTTQDDIARIAASLRAAGEESDDVAREVATIIAEVEARGDEAVAELTERFDGARIPPGSFEVPPARLEESLEGLTSPQRDALDFAAKRVAAFAGESLPGDWTMEAGPGLTVGQVARPIEPVGLYVPGGRYAYPSSALMTGIPARAAGVERIVFCSPPAKDGEVNPLVLAACAMVGGCRVFRIGGAQAIAAMAYGTATVPRCLMIAGPGNAYVAAAKRLVSRVSTVDLEAGPSEVVVYADSTVDTAFAAADLLAQLEHDPQALAVLVSESSSTVEAVKSQLQSGGVDLVGKVDLVWCASREQCVGLINAIAPEHAALLVADAADLLPRIRTAWAVFLGPCSAVALGDYVAGPSHVLPTGGAAARLSGLSAADFTRRMNVVAYTQKGLDADAGPASLLASLEGLDHHARSVQVRKSSQAPSEV